MNGGSASTAPASRLPELDGLRAMAILLVLLSHHLAYLPVASLRWFTEKGWVGVDLFFVLSGFLIGGILLDQRQSPNYYRVFYLRRFLRIAPLYLVLVVPGVLLLSCGLQSHLGGHSLASQSALSLWFCLFFVQNLLFPFTVPAYLGPTWSVAVEEQFYLLLPPLVRHFDVKKLLKILVAAIILAPVLRGVLLLAWGGQAAMSCYILLPCRWDSLLFGVLGAIAYRDARFRSWFAARLVRLQILWWLLLAASLGLLFTSGEHLEPRVAFLGYTLIDACFAGTLLLAVLNPAGTLNRVLSVPFFKPIAAISYGLYLLQSPMLAVVESAFRFGHVHPEKISWTETGIAMVSLTATFVVAGLSWRFFESRMIRLGHQHRYQPVPVLASAVERPAARL